MVSRAWTFAFAAMLAALGTSCTGTSAPDAARRASRGAPDGGDGLDANATAEATMGSSCHSDARKRLVCDTTKVSGVPWGDIVTVAAGRGEPPTPAGGIIVPGDYQLVSETIYGNVPPNVSAVPPGAGVQSVMHVDCDVMNELYGSSSTASGNDCRRLVPRALGVLEVSGLITASGPPLPDSRADVSYTTKGRDLVLSFLYPYMDYGSVTVLGSYTLVDEFAPVGAPTESHISHEDAGVTSSVPSGRDTRCPANPPASGDPCSPNPAPLECEYGGDAWRRCTTLAQCAMQLDGSFHFQITVPGACTPPNPPACPPAFAAASALPAAPESGAADAGTASGLSCNYAEGVCACQPRPTATGSTCDWLCRSGAPQPSAPSSLSCPLQRPLAGDACPAGLECDYENLCTPDLFIGPDMICVSGHWEALHLLSSCGGP
jgi:hypothetical protein